MSITRNLVRLGLGLYCVILAVSIIEGVDHPWIAKYVPKVPSFGDFQKDWTLKALASKCSCLKDHIPHLQIYQGMFYLAIGVLALTFSKYFYCFAPWVGVIHLAYIASGIYYMKGKFTRNNFWEDQALLNYLFQAIVFDSLWFFCPTTPCPVICGTEGSCPVTTTSSVKKEKNAKPISQPVKPVVKESTSNKNNKNAATKAKKKN